MNHTVDKNNPRQLRQSIRSGDFSDVTSGVAPGYVQCNLVIVPADYAADFLCRFVNATRSLVRYLRSAQSQEIPHFQISALILTCGQMRLCTGAGNMAALRLHQPT